MIRRRVSAVVMLHDSFLGRTVDGAGARCSLDGFPIKPQAKPGGLLVWTDLPEGRHTLNISLPGFLEESIVIDIDGDKIWEGFAELRPGRGYLYQGSAVNTVISLMVGDGPLRDAEVWLAHADDPPLKLTQTKAEKGAQTILVFRTNPADILPLPCVFILEDGKKPELIRILSINDKDAQLEAPLGGAHARGKALFPASPYRTNADGKFSVMLRKTGRLMVFYAGRLQAAELKSGNDRININFINFK